MIAFGLGITTTVGALMTGIGIFGWAVAWQSWQLFAAALLSGAGWVAMGAVAVNAIVARWYVTGRAPGAGQRVQRRERGRRHFFAVMGGLDPCRGDFLPRLRWSRR